MNRHQPGEEGKNRKLSTHASVEGWRQDVERFEVAELRGQGHGR